MIASSEFAPIVIFAYRRPDLLRRTLHALSLNFGIGQSEVFIFCDGPKANASHEDHSSILEVREIASKFEAGKKLHTSFRSENIGLAQSVMEGVDTVITQFGKVIVVEDDVDLSPYFLSFMNDALQKFSNSKDVGAVGSWNYFLGNDSINQSFFLRYPDSIAWATWLDRWMLLERDGRKLLSALVASNRDVILNADGELTLFTSMLRDQIEGKVDSWAIRWTASLVLNNRLTLYPPQSLSKHIGFGTGATHETTIKDYNKDLILSSQNQIVDIPDQISESKVALSHWINFTRATFQGKRGFKSRLWHILPTYLQQSYNRWRNRGTVNPTLFEVPPISRVFGVDRGTPVDRFYIETFLESHRMCFQGDGIEIGEVRYLNKFGLQLSSKRALVFEASQSMSELHGDLTQLDSLPFEVADVFICTQTLNFIFDVSKAIMGIRKILKQDGVALVTVAGVCQISRYDADRWGDYWRFMPQSIYRLFVEQFGKEQVEIFVFGNSYSAHSLLHGFSLEECNRNKLLVSDADYPVVIALKITKR